MHSPLKQTCGPTPVAAGGGGGATPLPRGRYVARSPNSAAPPLRPRGNAHYFPAARLQRQAGEFAPSRPGDGPDTRPRRPGLTTGAAVASNAAARRWLRIGPCNGSILGEPFCAQLRYGDSWAMPAVTFTATECAAPFSPEVDPHRSELLGLWWQCWCIFTYLGRPSFFCPAASPQQLSHHNPFAQHPQPKGEYSRAR